LGRLREELENRMRFMEEEERGSQASVHAHSQKALTFAVEGLKLLGVGG